jgi:hypothetical protein
VGRCWIMHDFSSRKVSCLMLWQTMRHEEGKKRDQIRWGVSKSEVIRLNRSGMVVDKDKTVEVVQLCLSH